MYGNNLTAYINKNTYPLLFIFIALYTIVFLAICVYFANDIRQIWYFNYKSQREKKCGELLWTHHKVPTVNLYASPAWMPAVYSTHLQWQGLCIFFAEQRMLCRSKSLIEQTLPGDTPLQCCCRTTMEGRCGHYSFGAYICICLSKRLLLNWPISECYLANVCTVR